ncbi:MAG: hypothetical protein L0Y76_12270 [Ignavibacteria bacterium]|nr:hypothetical protein [Ignavibacteria bacterium]
MQGFIIFQSCDNNPNDLGLEYILSDTLGTKVLNSNTDSMAISYNNFRKYVNTYSSLYFTVGKYQGYESKTLLRALNISENYDSSVVLSSYIKINYNKYAYRDTLGSVSFGIYSLTKKYDLALITNDSFSTSSVGTSLLGSYSGTPNDTAQILIPFDNTTAKNWLNYAADTNYPQKNYGIIFVPNGGSTTIKGFGTQFKPSSIITNLVPKVIITALKNGDTTTLIYDLETTSLSTTTDSPYLADRFVLQNGISYHSILNFDISKLPSGVIINQALLRLKLDRDNSYISPGTNKKLLFNLVTDSAAKTVDVTTGYISSEPDSVTYTVTLTPVFFRWNNASASNYGVYIRNAYDILNLDKFYFYGPNVQDTTKRPLLIIRYTPKD